MGFKTLLDLAPTGPTLFRSIDELRPTLLLDEVDSFFSSGDKDVIGILKAGYKRSGNVPRCAEIGGKQVVERFHPWGLKVLAGIGALPRALAERCIVSLLQKKKRGVKNIRLRERDTAEFAEIRSKALRWANDNRAQLDEIRDRNAVALPDALGDRDGETWEPLLAVSLLAGEVWRKRTIQAAEGIMGAATSDDDEYGVLLLIHIRTIFDDNPGHASLPSKFIFNALHGNDEWPWQERGSGKDRQRPLTLASMQATLSDFQVDVEPRAIRHKDPHGEKRGYLRAKFEEAWQTYCTPQKGHDQTAGHEPLSATGIFPHQGVPSVPNTRATGVSWRFSGCPRHPLGTPRNDAVEVRQPRPRGLFRYLPAHTAEVCPANGD
jgi:hypothetical protein